MRRKNNLQFTILIFISLLLVFDSLSMYRRVEIEKVPIERLIKNFELEIIDKPDDYHSRLSLGRLYAMSYSLKSDEIEVRAKDNRLWFGYEHDNVPHNRIHNTIDKEKLKLANEHIKKAIYWYEEAIILSPDNLIVQIGYGWCLYQVDRFEEAKDIFRSVAEISFEQEEQNEHFDRYSLSAEAYHYLLYILDPNEDTEEIKKLNERLTYIEKHKYYWITPIVIPLKDNLNVQKIIDENASIAFDLDGSGKEQKWSWIFPDVGWLVYDHNNNGKIESGRNLIGNITFWLFWDNGYEVLNILDDNRDGELDGTELKGLSIWHDRNSNGISDIGEVLPLSDWDISTLSFTYSEIRINDKVMWSCANGVKFKDGNTRPTYDILLQRKMDDEIVISQYLK